MSVLSVDGLRVRLPTPSGHVTVVDGVDYEVKPAEVTIGTHHLIVDEPVSSGGTDRGPDAYQLIAAALGT